MRPKLLLGTNNKGKIHEYRSLLRNIPYDLVTPIDQGITTVVEEGGDSFEENAQLKAVAFARASGLLALADDSGLEVDILGGEPGVRSARYAGKDASDAQRVSYLLVRLMDIPWEKRMARFRCVIAIAQPDGNVQLSSGECHGFITFTPRGERGFGYDPIFYFPQFDKTMAQLTVTVKNRISHRGQAARKAREILRTMATGDS